MVMPPWPQTVPFWEVLRGEVPGTKKVPGTGVERLFGIVEFEPDGASPGHMAVALGDANIDKA